LVNSISCKSTTPIITYQFAFWTSKEKIEADLACFKSKLQEALSQIIVLESQEIVFKIMKT